MSNNCIIDGSSAIGSISNDEKDPAENNIAIYKEEFYKFLDKELTEKITEDNISAIKRYYNEIDEYRNSQELLICSRLQKDLNNQILKCEALERSRSNLRSTIKKASASWSERKVQISESEEESISDDVNSPNDLHNDVNKRFNFDEELNFYVELKHKKEQLELSERRADDLNKRLKDFEKLIDDKEIIVHGLKEQLDTYFSDNQKMSKQLAELTKLFREIEATNCQEVNQPNAAANSVDYAENIPSQEEYQGMSKSVSKTYIKLKELIYEKKSLVTEIERLKILNVELNLRVSQQENRLVSVSDALQSTWIIVSNLKDEHAKIHSDESILRYELKEKREILHKLREELEWARDQWHKIRNLNSESEDEWNSLRNELDERQNKVEDSVEKPQEVRPVVENIFEPPIDLLLDMGIEYGIVDADDDEPATGIALMDGEDVPVDRLRDLEDQCGQLYQKLMTSTTRALALASRLTSLHELYSTSDEEDDENLEYEDDELLEDNNNDLLYASSIISQDSESNDTAYVSEADGLELTAETSTAEENAPPQEDNIYGSSPEDGCDVLSKRLLNFLPKKIEILSIENKSLQSKLQNIIDERDKSETVMQSSLDFERKQRRKLEEQLTHLGKCVNELKLERNGQIEKAEEELQRKIEEIDKEHKEHQQVIEEFEELEEKFRLRGEILQFTALQLEQAEIRATTAEDALCKFKSELDCLQAEMQNLKESHRLSRMPNMSEKNTGVHLSELSEKDSNEQSEISIGANGVIAVTKDVQNCASSLTVDINSKKMEHELDVYSPQIVLNKDATFRLLFYLTPKTILNWFISIPSQEITFGVTYVKENSTELSLDNLQTTEISTFSDDNCSLLDLISPVIIQYADSPSKGRLIPQISGNYCLNFKNTLSRTQLVKYQVWIQNSDEK